MKLKYIPMLLCFLSLVAACASEPPQPVNDPYNDADSQRKRASQAQDELSRDTAK